jgi:RNA polymerase sigma-70 factor (ECF subfamily)
VRTGCSLRQRHLRRCPDSTGTVEAATVREIDRTIRPARTSGTASTREDPLDLVARARKGDRESFNELVDLHLADLYRLAVVVAGPEMAEDVTQDAFLAAWQELPGLRDPDRFVPWLRRILVNRARDQHRGLRRQLRPTDLTAATDVAERRPGRADPAIEVDALTDLHRALAGLTLDQRAVVGLHYLADLTVPEVATILGIPTGTAKSRLNAALVVLRRRLGDTR